MAPSLTIPAVHLFLSGCYGLRQGDRYKYIGKSIAVLARVYHLVRYIEEGDEIDVWFCAAEDLCRVELELIKEHDPRYNIQGSASNKPKKARKRRKAFSRHKT